MIPNPLTPNPPPSTLNPKPQTQIPNPKPQIPNPLSPETLNHKLYAPKSKQLITLNPTLVQVKKESSKIGAMESIAEQSAELMQPEVIEKMKTIKGQIEANFL